MEQNMEFGHSLEHMFNSFDADDYKNDDDEDNADIKFEGLDNFLWSSEYPTLFYFYLSFNGGGGGDGEDTNSDDIQFELFMNLIRAVRWVLKRGGPKQALSQKAQVNERKS